MLHIVVINKIIHVQSTAFLVFKSDMLNYLPYYM